MKNSLTESDKARIEELKKEGYVVHNVCDQGTPLYGWLHRKSPAAQRLYKDRQPYRLTEAQAWDDCIAYAGCSMPSTPNPDWKQQK